MHDAVYGYGKHAEVQGRHTVLAVGRLAGARYDEAGDARQQRIGGFGR